MWYGYSYGYSNEHTFYALSRWRHFVDLWNDHRQLDLHIATPQQRLRFNDDNSNEPWHMWGPRYPLSMPLKLPKILMKSVVCIALAGNDLFSGFLINSRPTSGLRLRLASPRLATALSRLDLTIVCRSRFVSASDGSAVIIILLFALRLRSEVLDAYFVAWYICSFYSIQTQRNSRELVLTFWHLIRSWPWSDESREIFVPPWRRVAWESYSYDFGICTYVNICIYAMYMARLYVAKDPRLDFDKWD